MGRTAQIAIATCIAAGAQAACNANPTVNLGYASYQGIHNSTSKFFARFPMPFGEPANFELAQTSGTAFAMLSHPLGTFAFVRPEISS